MIGTTKTSSFVIADEIGMELSSLAAAKREAIERIWSILLAEGGSFPRTAGRSIEIQDGDAKIVFVVTFDEAIGTFGKLQ